MHSFLIVACVHSVQFTLRAFEKYKILVRFLLKKREV